MPFALPRSAEQQQAHNAQLQRAYASTRRVVPSSLMAEPLVPRRDLLDELTALDGLRRSGALTDDEFTRAKRTILRASNEAP